MLQIKKATEVAKFHGLKAILAGPPGAGKTYSIRTAPHEETLVLSAESGLLSIQDVPVDVVEVKAVEDIRNAYKYLSKEKHDYKWLFLDSLSEIAEVILEDHKRQQKDQRRAYMLLAEDIVRMCKSFRDLSGLNVILVAKEEVRVSDGIEPNQHIISMPGTKVANTIPYLFDGIFWLRVGKVDDELRRTFQCQPDENYPMCKDRSGRLGMFEEPNWQKLLDKILAEGK